MEGKSESVFISVLATRERWIHPSIVDMLVNAMTQERRRRVLYSCTLGIFPQDAARNYAAARFLETGADWVLHLDQDVDTVPWLLEALDFATPETDILGIKYPCAGHGEVARTCWALLPDGNASPPLVELKASGSGCLFVRRRVYETLPRPWFRFIYNEDGQLTRGEDSYFCEKARAAGFRIFGLEHPRFQCGHVIMANLLACPGALPLRLAWERALGADNGASLRVLHTAEPTR